MTTTLNQIITKRQALVELAARKARKSLASFIRFTWPALNKSKLDLAPFHIDICNRLDKAVDDYINGKSSYILISMPFRHSKSTLCSQFFPAYFIGRCLEKDAPCNIIQSGYSGALVSMFSKRVKDIIQTPNYNILFPNVKLRQGQNTQTTFGIENTTSLIHCAGLGGSVTGFSANLLVVDDAVKSRAEAVSPTITNRNYDSFRNDLMTRQTSPACIVLVVGTCWSVFDLNYRIEHDEEYKDLFEIIKYPARTITESNISYLWESMYKPEWYEQQYKSLGKQASALLDCNPIQEGGNLFNTSNIKLINENEFPNTTYYRGWDLASSEKERASDDPDYTVGTKAGVIINKETKVADIYIKDIVSCREEAPKRDKLIVNTILKDGPYVKQFVEDFAAYKDTRTRLQNLLSGKATLYASHTKGDKVEKASILEPSFELGTVYMNNNIPKGIRELFLQQIEGFPSFTHDDFVDSLSIAVSNLIKYQTKFLPITISPHTSGII